MTCGPVPGIANATLLKAVVADAFAARIASRSVQVASQVPSPASDVVVTTRGGGSSAKHAENSDVLPFDAVAVAVTTVPGGSGSLVASDSENASEAGLVNARVALPRN